MIVSISPLELWKLAKKLGPIDPRCSAMQRESQHYCARGKEPLSSAILLQSVEISTHYHTPFKAERLPFNGINPLPFSPDFRISSAQESLELVYKQLNCLVNHCTIILIFQPAQTCILKSSKSDHCSIILLPVPKQHHKLFSFPCPLHPNVVVKIPDSVLYSVQLLQLLLLAFDRFRCTVVALLQ